MRSLLAVCALIVIGLSQSLFAHSNLASSVPEDGAHTKGVTELQLAFAAPVRLTAVKLRNTDGREFALGIVSADPSELHTIAIKDTLTPGMYAATWRSIGADSHVVNGDLRFVVIEQ